MKRSVKDTGFRIIRAEFLNFLFISLSQKPNLKKFGGLRKLNKPLKLVIAMFYIRCYTQFYFLEYSVRNQRQVNLFGQWRILIFLFLN
jgi:hypothetical protein